MVEVNELLFLGGKCQACLHLWFLDMQFNFSMRKLRYCIFWILPSCHFFHNWDYWQLLFTFGKAETVIHKAETHSHLEFTSFRFLQISSSFLDFHTLDVVILQYRSSIRILIRKKSSSTWILQPWYCHAVALGTVFVLCSALCHPAQFCWPSWTSVDIPLVQPCFYQRNQ